MGVILFLFCDQFLNYKQNCAINLNVVFNEERNKYTFSFSVITLLLVFYSQPKILSTHLYAVTVVTYTLPMCQYFLFYSIYFKIVMYFLGL